jgi:hypothetical protein
MASDEIVGVAGGGDIAIPQTPSTRTSSQSPTDISIELEDIATERCDSLPALSPLVLTLA